MSQQVNYNKVYRKNGKYELITNNENHAVILGKTEDETLVCSINHIYRNGNLSKTMLNPVVKIKTNLLFKFYKTVGRIDTE